MQDDKRDMYSRPDTAPLRPILHHLNADSSWLLQVPRSDVGEGRRFFNVLIDPWLSGPQVDVAGWFSTQSHVEESKVRNIAGVESLALRTEQNDLEEAVETFGDKSMIDVVAISHEFTDHCHQATLVQVDATVPVFAPAKAAALVRSWKHFDTVIDMPSFNSKTCDWRTVSLAPLPSWLSVSRVMEERDALHLHSAVMIAWSSDHEEQGRAESVLYTPHGVTTATIQPLLTASPSISTLCMIHGLHDVSLKLTQQLNLGAHNGLKVQRALKPKYWFGTHDEVKKADGVVKFMIKRKVVTMEEALAVERKDKDRNTIEEECVYEYMDNGESRRLS